MRRPLYRLEGVSLRYPRERRWALRGISLEVRPGEALGLVGANGSGKTTLLRVLAGLMVPQEGRVAWEGRPLGEVGRRSLARQVARVGQSESIPPGLTALEFVLLGRAPHLGWWGWEGEEDRARASRALETIGGLGLAGRPVAQLSAGERQRVLLARALAQEARVWLLDEPTAHLDVGRRGELIDLLRRLRRARPRTLVLASHDLGFLRATAGRALALREGALVGSGPPGRLLRGEVLVRLFGPGARRWRS